MQSRRLVDGQENLLENECSRAEIPNLNHSNLLVSNMIKGLQEDLDFLNNDY